MDFNNFVNEFIIKLEDNDKKCIKLLENNKKLIEVELSKDGNPKSVKRFVTEINNTIIQIKKKKYLKLYEEILKHDSLKYVYNVFRKSDVLIQACKYGNEKVAEWLLTMDIDPYVQDKKGMTALMHAIKNPEPIGCVIGRYENDYKNLNMEDKNGNNVLFYSIDKPKFYISYLKNADINHINRYGETILHYCSKNKSYNVKIKTFFEVFENIDLNIPDKDGKTVTMCFIENQLTYVLDYMNYAEKKLAFNYVNEYGESVLSFLIKKMYSINARPIFDKDYVDIIIGLIKADVDFNTVVDEDGNTALMVFLIAGDYETFYFVTKYSHQVDLIKKNKYGENVTSLILKLNILNKYINNFEHKEFKFSDNVYTQSKDIPLFCGFDYKYVDPINKNTALILATIKSPSLVKHVIRNNYSSINYVNIHQENALIIAAKMNKYDIVSVLLKTHIHVNQQDAMGNSALHYAVQNKNVPMINNLVKQGADINIENNNGETALKMGKDMNDSSIMKALLGTLSLSELDKEIKSMRDINALIRHQYIEEYIYTRVSRLYRKITSESLDNLRKCYYSNISTVNSELSRVTSIYNNYDFGEFKESIYNHKDELPLLNLFIS